MQKYRAIWKGARSQGNGVSEGGGWTLHGAGGASGCETEPEQLMLLLRLGCRETRRVLQELSGTGGEAPATSGCQQTHVPCAPRTAPGTLQGFTLARPKDCTDPQATRGFKQPPALTQAVGLFHKPRVCRGAE